MSFRDQCIAEFRKAERCNDVELSDPPAAIRGQLWDCGYWVPDSVEPEGPEDEDGRRFFVAVLANVRLRWEWEHEYGLMGCVPEVECPVCGKRGWAEDTTGVYLPTGGLFDLGWGFANGTFEHECEGKQG